MRGLGSAVLVATVCAAPAASAQSGAAVQPGRVEVAVGAGWSGRTPFGRVDATETNPTGGRYVLFTTTSELGSAVGAEAHIGVRITRLLQVEGDGAYATPEIRTTVGGDVEQGAGVTATERLQQITVGGGLALSVPWRSGRRVVPFVAAGAAYLRQLHQGQTLIETGRAYYAGGGLKYWFTSRPAGRLKAMGLRADVRAVTRTASVALDRRTHTTPSLGISLAVAF